MLTLGGWWALGSDRAVYDPMFSDLQDLDRIEYFVTDSNGTGKPGVWVRPSNPRYDAMVREHFEVMSDTLPRTPYPSFWIQTNQQRLRLRLGSAAARVGAASMSNAHPESIRLIVCERSMAVEHQRFVVGKRSEKKIAN